ncbi:MAG TPA: ankyrin repeat domain-containing protein [Pseudonocardiaceae bacterium]|nr:ankyrin repeat domain-containing protein [Pseudonocardiaceae bacterium]
MSGFDVPLGRLMRVAPGLPTADMARTVEHYQRLGFHFKRQDDEFAIAERGGVELHFSYKSDHDPKRTAGWVYVTVEDTDALAAEFLALALPPRREPHDTDYGMREFAHVDPDGNLLLFGSRQGGSTPPDFDQRAFTFAIAVNRGDVAAVREFLAEDPSLATSRFNSRWPLHLFADYPGHRPNAAAMVAALVEAGADLDAQAVDMWHEETALHWAASNDDVELIDVLLDAGADIEHPGSSIGGGPPSQSAVGYGKWAALRRLHERGAEMTLGMAAALGLLPMLTESTVEDVEELSVALWNACRAGQLAAAQYLLGRGADVHWVAPWSGETAWVAARHARQEEIVAWLNSLPG